MPQPRLAQRSFSTRVCQKPSGVCLKPVSHRFGSHAFLLRMSVFAFAGACLLSVACGQVTTYGNAPGRKLEPDPTPTQNPEPEPAPTPEPDAGTPLPDGGEPCVPSPGVEPSFEESEVNFSATGLPAKMSACAACHKNKPTTEGNGQDWGAVSDTPGGWHEAFRTLYDAEIADNSLVTLGANASDIVNVFTISHQGRAADATAQSDVEGWISYMTTPGDPVVCEEVEPPCEPVVGGLPDETAMRAEFAASDLQTEYNADCARCHGGKSPTAAGFSWGAVDESADAWFDAVAALVALSPVATPADHSLVTHFSNGHGGSIASSAGATSMTDYLTFTTTDVPAVVCP
ncbi:MAG: hypothetical protein GY822_29830 [Deltaproteobacteria bacterium]|nr:hypothetical protein [Deltaproteobacteria bacterium]